MKYKTTFRVCFFVVVRWVPSISQTFSFILTFMYQIHLQISPIDEIFQYMAYMMLLMALMTQIFLLCYFGNEVIIKSEQLSTQMYSSNWTDLTIGNVNFKKTMLVFQERLKRKTQVVVLLLFPFSLDTFAKVSHLNIILSFVGTFNSLHRERSVSVFS